MADGPEGRSTEGGSPQEVRAQPTPPKTQAADEAPASDVKPLSEWADEGTTEEDE